MWKIAWFLELKPTVEKLIFSLRKLFKLVEVIDIIQFSLFIKPSSNLNKACRESSVFAQRESSKTCSQLGKWLPSSNKGKWI